MGFPKLGLKLRGRGLLERVLDSALASNVDEIVLVLSPETVAPAEARSDPRVRAVINRGPESGQSGSLRLGLQSIDPGSQAAIFLLGDQPLVTSDVIDALIAHHQATGKAIVASSYGGRRGSPVLFERSLFGELLALEGDTGGREIIARHGEQLATVEVGAPEAGSDIDTWDDYMALRRQLEGTDNG